MDEKTENAAFAERLDLACRAAGIPGTGDGRQAVLSENLHVSQQAASKWLTGKGKPHRVRLNELAEFLGVSAQWLASGQGEMTLPGEALPLETMSNLELEIIRLMREMSLQRRKDMVAIARALSLED